MGEIDCQQLEYLEFQVKDLLKADGYWYLLSSDANVYLGTVSSCVLGLLGTPSESV